MGENNPVYNSSGTSICKNERHIQSCAKNLMEIVDLATKLKEMKLMTQMI